MSLKETLLNRLKTTGHLTLDDIKNICNGGNDLGRFYKESTAERELRILAEENKNIKHIYIKNYIAEYIWQNNPAQSKLFNAKIKSIYQEDKNLITN